MKTILTILLSVVCISVWGQIKFDKGYFLDNSGKKTECLIENKDWMNNPSAFQYKLSENEQPIKGNLATIKAFEIYNYSKFVRAFVQLDTSVSIVLSRLSTNRNPEWTSDTLFLKVVLEGNASLYYYEAPNLKRFFYKTAADTSIRQLVYKEYRISNSTIGENGLFRQQLYNEVRCGDVSSVSLRRMAYKTADLKKYFTTYNTCMGDVVPEPKSYVNRDLLNFKITPGISYSSLSVENTADRGRSLEFDKGLFFRLGLEVEYILPFNKNKWSAFIEPTYQYFNSDKVYLTSRTAKINYQSIEFPIGLRHYFFLKDNSKIFLNAIIVPGVSKEVAKSSILYGSTTTTRKSPISIKTRTTFAMGAGYNIGPFSLEARYCFNQEILGEYVYYASDYQKTTLIVGYRFIKIKTKVVQ